MLIIALQSCDGEIFEVERKIIMQFIFLRNMFEHFGVDEDEDPLILPNFNTANNLVVVLRVNLTNSNTVTVLLLYLLCLHCT